MKITVVYNYPIYGQEHDDFALRFALSYSEFPPGYEHDTLIVSNGGHATTKMRSTMEYIGNFPKPRWYSRNNTAKDIGAYRDVAKTSASDLMIFFGGSIFFWKAGWLKRIVEAYQKHGNTVYGTMTNGGEMHVRVFPHIRTTGFWLSPSLLARHPMKVVSDEDRYEFEHGRNCLTMWAVRQKLKPKLITWDNEYDVKAWRNAPESFHQGNQLGLLFKDRLAEPPYYLK